MEKLDFEAIAAQFKHLGTTAVVLMGNHACVAVDTLTNRWASRQMVGWIEEVHKGLERLRRNDTRQAAKRPFRLLLGSDPRHIRPSRTLIERRQRFVRRSYKRCL